MKFLHILTLLLVAMVAYTSAQRCIGRPRNPPCSGPRNVGRQRCVGRPRNPSCSGPRNVGRRGPRCTPRNMWYYDQGSRQCRQMRYNGCAGNNNRWCTRAACQQRCRR